MKGASGNLPTRPMTQAHSALPESGYEDTGGSPTCRPSFPRFRWSPLWAPQLMFWGWAAAPLHIQVLVRDFSEPVSSNYAHRHFLEMNFRGQQWAECGSWSLSLKGGREPPVCNLLSLEVCCEL